MSKSEKIIELIFGKRGSGKSYLAQKLMAGHRRYLIYDTLGEYKDGIVIQNLQELKPFWHKVYRRNFRIVYQPLKPVQEFESICELVWECENMAFLVEEIDCFCSSLSLGDSFQSVIQRGRHRDISLIGVTQRPHGIARLITSQAKQMYIFNTTEPRDIEYFRQVLGENVVQKFADLKQYEFVKWQDGNEQLEIGRA